MEDKGRGGRTDDAFKRRITPEATTKTVQGFIKPQLERPAVTVAPIAGRRTMEEPRRRFSLVSATKANGAAPMASQADGLTASLLTTPVLGACARRRGEACQVLPPPTALDCTGVPGLGGNEAEVAHSSPL